MINWGVTAACNLIPANWDFSHISPEQNAFPNEFWLLSLPDLQPAAGAWPG